MAGDKDPQEEKVAKPPDAERNKKPHEWLIENIAEASKNARKIY